MTTSATKEDCAVRAVLLRDEPMRQNMLSTIDSTVVWVAVVSWPEASGVGKV